jgi:hypothetical protein
MTSAFESLSKYVAVGLLTIAVLRLHGVSPVALNHGLNRSFVYSYLQMKKKEIK